ncbi:transporter [Streptococcus infantarius subsp. infantarius]|nr:transporter [Streptococcus infantarius subsp. infantarius]
MMNWIMTQNVVFLAFLAGLFTWGCTILGSAVVFFFTKVSRKLLDIMMGFAAGVMIAASFWSLLDPALAYAAGAMMFVVVEELIPESQTNGNTDVATLGLMVGFVIMMVMDVALG